MCNLFCQDVELDNRNVECNIFLQNVDLFLENIEFGIFDVDLVSK